MHWTNVNIRKCYKRKNTKNYEVEFSYEDVDKIANKVKNVPMEFITPNGNNVTKECMEYIAPLIDGERKLKYKNGLPVHFKIK